MTNLTIVNSWRDCEVPKGVETALHERPSIMLDIEAVERVTSGGGVWVRLKGSGMRVCLPQGQYDCLPGAVVITEWLARKLKRPRKEKVNKKR